MASGAWLALLRLADKGEPWVACQGRGAANQQDKLALVISHILVGALV